jgi:hypothetical protein
MDHFQIINRYHETTKIVLKEADIDNEMIEIVQWINSLDCYTLFSCQGEALEDGAMLPYVLFVCWSPESLKKITNSVESFNDNNKEIVDLNYSKSLVSEISLAPKITLSMGTGLILEKFVDHIQNESEESNE